MKTNLSLTLIVACTLLTACNDNGLVGPDDAEQEIATLDAAANLARPATMTTADVISFSDFETVTGISRLGRTEEGVGLSLKTSQIPAGQAITIWFVVFNNPEACGTSPCGEADLFVPEVEADILYGAGNVMRPTGATSFTGNLRVGDTTGSIADVFALPAASGLQDAMNAEIHYVVRSHGPAVPGLVKEQTTTFDGGCEVDLPAGEMPDAIGECADVQFAIHMAQ